MLTYSGFADLAQWRRFLSSLTDEQLQTWGVKHWCATLERLACYASRASVYLFMCVCMCHYAPVHVLEMRARPCRGSVLMLECMRRCTRTTGALHVHLFVQFHRRQKRRPSCN